MSIQNSKRDPLTNNTYLSLPYFSDLTAVPAEYTKDSDNNDVGFRAVILSKDTTTGAEGVYVYNGTTFELFGQAAGQIPVFTTANRPTATAATSGLMILDSDLGKAILNVAGIWKNVDGTAL